MAVSLQEAQAKWARNAQAGASRWHGDPEAYCQGLAKLGVNPQQCLANIGQRYAQGVAAVPVASFQQAIAQAAMTDKWSRDWLRAMNG